MIASGCILSTIIAAIAAFLMGALLYLVPVRVDSSMDNAPTAVVVTAVIATVEIEVAPVQAGPTATSFGVEPTLVPTTVEVTEISTIAPIEATPTATMTIVDPRPVFTPSATQTPTP